ncbi:hypothetical protein NKH18_29490 [Streptomyces sp. M10(2022)]
MDRDGHRGAQQYGGGARTQYSGPAPRRRGADRPQGQGTCNDCRDQQGECGLPE